MKYRFYNWLIENKDWNWKPQEWEPNAQPAQQDIKDIKAKIAKNPTTYFTNKKPPSEWKNVFYTKMREFMQTLSQDDINAVMYRFNQIIKNLDELEKNGNNPLGKDDVIKMANKAHVAYDTNNILGKLFNMI
jgi:hypothetical protein